MKLLFLIALLYGAYWCWDNGKLPMSHGGSDLAVDASGNSVVWIFTTPGCDPCTDALAELRRRGVAFVEKVVTPDQADNVNFKLWKSMGTGQSFPLIVAGKEHVEGFYVPDIASLLATSFGDAHLTTSEQRYFQAHFNDDGSPRIVLYGTDWCPSCAALRKTLRANQVAFEDVDVEKIAGGRQLMQTMGISGYPATWVGYTRVKNGSSYTQIMSLLNKNTSSKN